MESVVLRGPLLCPRADDTVEFYADGALAADGRGVVTHVGRWRDELAGSGAVERVTGGVILPPMIDCHIHVPQHPVRGHFTDGVDAGSPNGRLLEGLNRNVFPAEGRCSAAEYAEGCARDFLVDTLAHGVVGGVAYVTVHAEAVRAALRVLPDTWRAGLVLMDQNCPEYLRNDEATLARDLRSLAEEFGPRLVVTDRFAVACSTPLRVFGSGFARDHGLRTQTHLNEQRAEKRLVEETLYPTYASYTDVYRRDGLLDGRRCLLAHCIHMREQEFDVVAGTGSVVVHCPVSNTLLGSGVMPLDEVRGRRIPWAICTDVGASPTTSLLAEMAQFLKVHEGRARVTPSEALCHTTVHAAAVADQPDLAGFAVGRPLSYVVAKVDRPADGADGADGAIRELTAFQPFNDDEARAAEALREGTLDAGRGLERLTENVWRAAAAVDGKVVRTVLRGRTVFERGGA